MLLNINTRIFSSVLIVLWVDAGLAKNVGGIGPHLKQHFKTMIMLLF